MSTTGLSLWEALERPKFDDADRVPARDQQLRMEGKENNFSVVVVDDRRDSARS